jgi:hypothetical protein
MRPAIPRESFGACSPRVRGLAVTAHALTCTRPNHHRRHDHPSARAALQSRATSSGKPTPQDSTVGPSANRGQSAESAVHRSGNPSGDTARHSCGEMNRETGRGAGVGPAEATRGAPSYPRGAAGAKPAAWRGRIPRPAETRADTSRVGKRPVGHPCRATSIAQGYS